MTVVFGALVAGFLVEQGRRDDPLAELEFRTARRPAFDQLEIPAGEHRLAGEVRTAAGDPAPEVEVFLYRATPLPGVAEPVHWTFTDQDGRFVLDELFAADCEVALIQPGLPTKTLSITIPHAGEVSWALPEPLGPLPVLPKIERADLVGALFPPLT